MITAAIVGLVTACYQKVAVKSLLSCKRGDILVLLILPCTPLAPSVPQSNPNLTLCASTANPQILDLESKRLTQTTTVITLSHSCYGVGFPQTRNAPNLVNHDP